MTTSPQPYSKRIEALLIDLLDLKHDVEIARSQHALIDQLNLVSSSMLAALAQAERDEGKRV